jgi:hypothetical protein
VDYLYNWTPPTGLQPVSYDSRVWDAKVFGDNAVIIDRVNSQVALIHNITGQTSVAVIADAEAGLRTQKPS